MTTQNHDMISVAGGTGSRVGTYASRCLREDYPNSFILNHLTWPMALERQENYTSVLTLAQYLYPGHEHQHISFSDFNKVIAHQLGSVLQSALTVAYHTLCTVFPFELMSGLVCHPEYKLLIFCNIPQVSSSSMAYSVFTWPGLLQHQHQMLTAFCMLLIHPVCIFPILLPYNLELK
uniref:Uncharacterized protein n=1 Tax=Oncorhynchus tshawytscha TaxID=74940 RepID=A0A8C8F1J1_ONCTS